MPGYEFKFVHTLLKRHECTICCHAMRNPMQAKCGHRFCEDCLESILSERRPICPLDKEEISLDGIFPDNACRREILNLDVYCTFGCGWIGKLKELDAHIDECDYRDVQCTLCGQHVQMLTLSRHKETECPMRPQRCVHCGEDVPVQQMQAHLDKVCLKVLHPCPNKCDPTIQLKLPELQKHLDLKKGDCPLSEMECPYNIYGSPLVATELDYQPTPQTFPPGSSPSEDLMRMFEEYNKHIDEDAKREERVHARAELEERATQMEQKLDAQEGEIESTKREAEETDVMLQVTLGSSARHSALTQQQFEPKVLHPCPNRCDPTLQLKLQELQIHLDIENGDCPLTEMSCPYNLYGCSFVSLRKNIQQHLQQYGVYHAQIQADFFLKMKQESEEVSHTAEVLIERVTSLEQRFSLAERQLDSYRQQFEMEGGAGERKPEQYSSKINTLEQQAARLESQMTHLQRKMETASSGYGSEVHAGMLGTSASRYSPPTPQQFETLTSKVTELDHSLDRCLSSSLDQELRLQLLERATYNGILLWKIDDFTRRRREAVDGVTLSLYSTPFYTSRHGYKMCARVYLNGDGLGKGTHLSFFFVIMRGPFDALLVWPFKQKVTLMLINQAGKKHVTDRFRPDPHSSSFQRPRRKEINIASGFPMFIRVEHLLNGGFIRDDCIFLRIVVDTSDLPT